MNRISLVTLVVSLFLASSLLAQTSLVPPSSISFYRLSHKPPKEARRFFQKGSAEVIKHHYQSAIHFLRQAIDLDPGYFAAENNLGLAYLELSDRDQAEQAFRRALEIDPVNPIGHTNLSVVAMSRNDFNAAEKSARTALRLDPRIPEAKAMLGYAEVAQGHWTAEARRLLEESRQTVPGCSQILEKWPPPNQPGPSITVTAFHFR